MKTDIRDIGEFGLIEQIKKQFARHQSPSTIKGIGDDAAVIASDKTILISTDMLLENIHFDLTYTTLQYLGYKAVAVNISDIAAMNGKATQITTNIGISNRFSLESVQALYEGIKQACDTYKVDLIGGDTTSSKAGLVISVTVVGEIEKHKITYRSGAKKNNIICVTGDLGAAYMGLHILNREKVAFLANPHTQPDISAHTYIVQRQLKPEARVDIIHDLSTLGIVPTSMIDISDGLASELLHICNQSGVGVRIYEEHIPIANNTLEAAVLFQIEPITAALNGGEDYELLFTIDQKDYEKVKKHADIRFIGYITENTDAFLVSKENQYFSIQAQGWKHF